MMVRLALGLSLAVLVFLPGSLSLANDGDSTATEIVDSMLKEAWKDNDIKAAKRCSDSEFLRRVSLDITGTVPSLERALRFLRDKSRNKRAKLIDELLASDEYAKHWGRVWVDVLLGSYVRVERGRANMFMRRMEGTLRGMFRENVAYDEFVRKLVTVTGQVTDGEEGGDPIVFWYMQYLRNRQDRPQKIAGKMAKTFLSTQIQCAECHDHPFDTWTQEDFNGMSAFFAQTRVIRRQTNRDEERKARKEGKKRPRRLFQYEVMDARRGEFRVKGKRQSIAPEFLGTGQTAARGEVRRNKFSEYLIRHENFARSFVNRTWFYFFGRGVIEPFDDFTARNRESIKGLLDALADDFIENKYDIKHLIRSLANSEAYQLTSALKKRDTSIARYFPHAQVRPISPTVLVTSVFDASGLADMEERRRVRDRVMQTFRYAFEDDEGSESAQFEGTIPQALLLMNGQLAQYAVENRKGSLINRVMGEFKRPRDRVEAIFLGVLSRLPTTKELGMYLQHAARDKRGEAYADIIWVLLNSNEFLFNH